MADPKITDDPKLMFAIGLIIGLMANNPVVATLMIMYVFFMMAMRMLLYLVITMGYQIGRDVINRDLGVNILDNKDISIRYDIMGNKVTVSRTIKGAIITDRDEITAMVKTIFKTVLAFDVLFHLFPPTLHFV